MKRARFGIMAALTICWGLSAQARVFQMGNESFATYLRGQYGMALQKDNAYASSSSASAVHSGEYTSNMAYEIGFVYASRFVNWRFGFEILKPADLKGATGSSAAGAEWYSVTNNISGYAPKIGLEFNLKQWPKSRLFANADYGLATVTVQNSYTFTAAGTAANSGLTDFREEVQGSGNLIETSLGFETLLSDSTTIVFDAGYRSLEVANFKHKADVTGFQGAVVAGDAAKNTNGSDRTLSLSGGFASIILRFWIK